MNPARRVITLFTPGKIYSGEIDVPNPTLRTTDLLNSPNIYWRDPKLKNFSDGLLMYHANLSIDGVEKYRSFKTIQIRQPNIIFFHDGFIELSNTEEKVRAGRLTEKANEDKQTIQFITQTRMNSFFDIRGTFHGLFKSKSNQKYIPLSDAVLHEVIRQQDKWVMRKVKLANNFIGVNSSYIESCTIL